MSDFNQEHRASGILAHITSLPSPYGIGDIGPASTNFLKYLEDSGQKYWQILPTCPTSLLFDSSPYMSTSAFAGSPLLISPDLLVKDGYLSQDQLIPLPSVSHYLTHYDTVTTYKLNLLKQAFELFKLRSDKNYDNFCKQTPWLKDYALFMTLKEVHDGKPWFQWPHDIAKRSPEALAKKREMYAEQIDYFQFEQYIFHSQWLELRRKAQLHSVKIIGDIPIYVGLDSADVWANQPIFELDTAGLKPLYVSGVPPDYFSKTGQRWGNPLYHWHAKDKSVKAQLLDWWTERFRSVFKRVDVARIDHFRGFESYWAIPESEETAVKGTWLKGPGAPFFKTIQNRLGTLNIIAEDLGDITKNVTILREKLGFPGMKVLQFAFDGSHDNPFLPHNFTSSNCVVYTGTHDNDTTLGWFLTGTLDDTFRQNVKRMANRSLNDGSSIHEDFIYLALSSTAKLAIIPLQDLLGFGSDCRMNTPGTSTGNWQWRCAPEFLTAEKSSWLKEITSRFGRCIKIYQNNSD